MSVYGDAEPEDTWTASDAVGELVRNLARRIVLVDNLPAPRGTSLRAILAAIAHRVEVARRRHNLTPRDRLRLEQLADDLEYTRRRL